ncbi:DUF6165 family protein [Sphingomonas sp. Mn802worker]|uniref:DUF6165 family protein n=1 Tax=Sphingomonas sp. Mn802worker TaxID=629773 RepID=UPI000399DFAC|nr:DUF6165 family protein [Sphingomonas sp. Mn802worker]
MASKVSPMVPVSWGELLDKISILEIKCERIVRADARANVANEHRLLSEFGDMALRSDGIAPLYATLKAVNEDLWEIEDAIREQEAAGTFGAEFVHLARAVYHKNDERAGIKRAINLQLGSELIEEKSYADMHAVPAAVQQVPMFMAAR